MSTRPFTPSWLAGDPAAVGFLARDLSSAARAAAVARAGRQVTHPAVVAALGRGPLGAQQARHLAALAQPGTTCVVTGQQAGLFGGPLYTIYKAASAVVNARALAEETGQPCVPVFWLQNEDHDFAEIAHCRVHEGEVRVPADPHNRRSVGALTLGPEVDAALDTLAGWLGEGEVLACLRACYTREASPDGAFAALINQLFADTGLLILNPRAPGLAEAAWPIHQRALAEAGPIAAALEARAQALETAGYFVQVHVRPGAPLSFFHPEGPDGPRVRVAADDPALATARPDQFSTSALLRPLLQDTWLPTAAYVGGPGEIAYFAQLAPLYAHFDRAMPLVVPRARFRVLDAGMRRQLELLDVSADEVAMPRDALLARVGRTPEGQPTVSDLEVGLRSSLLALTRFLPQATALDKGLGQAVEQTRTAMTAGIDRLVDRYRRTLARSDELLVKRLDRIRASLVPDGAPQERVLGWPTFAARTGISAFTEAVLAATVAFDGHLKDLHI